LAYWNQQYQMCGLGQLLLDRLCGADGSKLRVQAAKAPVTSQLLQLSPKHRYEPAKLGLLYRTLPLKQMTSLIETLLGQHQVTAFAVRHSAAQVPHERRPLVLRNLCFMEEAYQIIAFACGDGTAQASDLQKRRPSRFRNVAIEASACTIVVCHSHETICQKPSRFRNVAIGGQAAALRINLNV
jgi:hypothetical protein